MKHSLYFAGIIFLYILASCQPRLDISKWMSEMETAFTAGEFSRVQGMADSLRISGITDNAVLAKSDSMAEICLRIRRDFSLSDSVVFHRLAEAGIVFTEEEMSKWEKLNWLEFRTIDGEKRYFNRTVSNLQRMLNHLEAKPKDSPDYILDDFQRFKLGDAKAIIKATSSVSGPVVPVRLKLRYKVTVSPDAVPAGDTILCWLPYPMEHHNRQQEVRLLAASPSGYIISPDSAAHRSIYFEQTAEAGKAAEFTVEFSYISAGQYFDPSVIKVEPYNKAGQLYRKFTAEEPPHILFSEKVRKLSSEILGEEKRPLEVTRLLFHWIDANIPWAGALEYSIISQIPEYVIDNRRGDCGMKTLLIMSLLRYNGIPVRWQSGWMLHPGEVNLHDWCEVYYEGTGWVPLDMSFGVLPSVDRSEREFYMTGMDAYRLIVNDAVAAPFYPEKEHFRSEPYDFQRGEVEWKGGNLYFDKWRYNMEVEYL